MPDLVPVDYDPFQAEQMGSQALAQTAGKVIGGLAQQLWNTPREALQASEQLRTTGDYDPAPIVNAATMGMTGGVAGVPLRAGEAALGSAPIRAYHGSPYDFDKFDLSKIGTGEGAQAYGHGLYFAEEPATAQSYRDKLKDINSAQTTLRTQYRAAILDNSPDPGERLLAGVMRETNGDADKAATILDAYAARNPKDDAIQKALSLAKSGATFDFRPGPDYNPGRMYEVNINADPEHFLDWDKPLSEQSEHVQQVLSGLKDKRVLERLQNLENPSGYDAYSAIGRGKTAGLLSGVSKAGTPERDIAATATLRQAGIPGIRYLDQGSRGKGSGTSNYVVFSPEIIDIVKKYGLAGLIAGGAAHFKTQPVEHDPFADGASQ